MGVVTMETSQPLVYEHTSKRESLLEKLNVLRRNGQFCDVTLIVGEHETPAHRAVLASTSPFLFDIFSGSGDDKSYPQVKLKGIEYVSFEHLLNYAYSAKLEVPGSEVYGVYKAAIKLRIAEVTDTCARYLALNLTPDNCLEIRNLAEQALRMRVDQYVRNNFSELRVSNVMSILPRINVDIVGADEDILSTSNEDQLVQLVVDWIKNSIREKHLDKITTQSYMVFMNADNALTDCSQLTDTEELSQSQEVREYRKTARKFISGNTSKSPMIVPRSPNVKRFSIHGNGPVKETEWTVIATSQTAPQKFTALAVMANRLMKLVIRLVTADMNKTEPETLHSPKNETAPLARKKPVDGRQASLVPLEKMSCARCTMGVLVVNGELIVCGGYDRGECMSTVESYDMDTNHWRPLPGMLTPRGRFDVGDLDGKLYACGGSDGSVELSSVECFDFKAQKWSYVASLLGVRSNAGVAVLKGKLYCVGGRTSVSPVNSCQVYDPVENRWRYIAPLNFPRSQASVCSFSGHLVAAGGSDAWNCHCTVEMYDPETDSWELVGDLNTARRGAGIAVLNGKVYVVGGNDGSQSLASVEIYQPMTDTWIIGPPLIKPRANVGVAVLGKNLMAVGGFSGKKFLDTIEYLNEEEKSEWCMYLPIQAKAVAEKQRVKRQSGDFKEASNHTQGLTDNEKGARDPQNGGNDTHDSQNGENGTNDSQNGENGTHDSQNGENGCSSNVSTNGCQSNGHVTAINGLGIGENMRDT